jgi:hypothetical protein
MKEQKQQGHRDEYRVWQEKLSKQMRWPESRGRQSIHHRHPPFPHEASRCALEKDRDIRRKFGDGTTVVQVLNPEVDRDQYRDKQDGGLAFLDTECYR